MNDLIMVMQRDSTRTMKSLLHWVCLLIEITVKPIENKTSFAP
jgi:hypothetical protein